MEHARKQPGWQWIKNNLFASKLDSLITLVIAAGIVLGLSKALSWLLIDATFLADSGEGCRQNSGACWAFIGTRWNQIVYGFYPPEQQWRVNLIGLIGLVSYLPFFLERLKKTRAHAFWAFLIYPVFGWYLLTGGFWGLEQVDREQWGGIMLTFIVAGFGIICSLPLGIILAFGRRSELPVYRSLSILFIEFWRGVPLITVLFMSSVMLPLFLPEGTTFDKLLRVLIGVSLFSAAYMAEVVRGGLQALPRGQTEAAQALGLSALQTKLYIVLPQALKHVIPGIVNTFIGLFKDTTLVTIVGMMDILGILQSAAGDSDWLGFAAEGYVFAAAFFFVCCYAMSRYSKAIETKLDRGH